MRDREPPNHLISKWPDENLCLEQTPNPNRGDVKAEFKKVGSIIISYNFYIPCYFDIETSFITNAYDWVYKY